MSKRTLKTLSLGDKAKIIAEIDAKVDKKMDIARKYGIPSSTLSTIIKNRHRILEFGREPDRKRIKTGKFPQLEEELWKWILTMSDQCPTLSGKAIRKKAQNLAEEQGCPEFQASVGWLEKFRSRHNLKTLKKKIILPTEASTFSDSSYGGNEEEFILPVKSPRNDEFLESTSPIYPVPDIIIKQEFTLADEYDWNPETGSQSPNPASASPDLFASSHHLQRQSESSFLEDTENAEETHQFDATETKLAIIPPLSASPTSTEAKFRNTRNNIPNAILRSQLLETKNARLIPNSATSQTKDHLECFGDYIVSKLKRMDTRTCILVQKAINDTIFDAEMGTLESVGADTTSSRSFDEIPSTDT